MKYFIKKEDWEQKNKNIVYEEQNGKLILKNITNIKQTIKCKKIINLNEIDKEKFHINIIGKCKNSGGYITINKNYNIPINSEVNFPIYNSLKKLNITLTIAANSEIELKEINFDTNNTDNFINMVDKNTKVLVIVPDYPSYVNLYSCAFAHSRNKEYLLSGINIQVFSVNPSNWIQIKYKRNNIPVIKGTYQDLKELLSKHQYSVIITHFVDEYLYPIFDGDIFENQKLLFICHGPETVYRYLVNKTRQYFTKPYKEPVQKSNFDLKDYYVKKYANKDNVEWIFVSEWLKEFSEKEQNLKFKHSRVINNIIDEDLFPYYAKTEDARKKILVVRKFDNICQHSIDQIVFAILELSRRDFFADLDFDIYGDGNYYEKLIEPIKNFDNVHLYRRFIPNEELSEIYQNHGIILLPSRHDAHAVSMGESASSGLVVIGSNVTSNPYFMNEKENHTLADPEDYVGLANIVERLYKNPQEFLEISKRMAEFTRQFKKSNTVAQEINLIKRELKECETKETFKVQNVKRKIKKPILTIGIPAYNVEKYIEKCLVSILNSSNANKIEVLVINDGSTDNTAKIIKKYEKLSNGVVRLINKENGGHGSAINMAIKEANGKYFRLIDGDDWVDSENLSKLVDIMETNECDIILTTGSYDYIETATLKNIISYDFLNEGSVYNFEDLTYPEYGFKKYGPLLTTGNYKTSILKKTNIKITEKKPYVDMEFNAFSIKNIKTITYYDLNIYRYLIGREGQTISPEYWKKKYKDHEYIIFNILDKVFNDIEYTPRKKEFILNNIIASMVDSQIYMFDTIGKLNEIDNFLAKIKNYPGVYEHSINYIEKLNSNCWLILNYYKYWLSLGHKDPIIIPGVRETIDDVAIGGNRIFKRAIKAFMPYGVLVLIRKWRSQNDQN